MKTSKKKIKQNYEEEYNKIMTGIQPTTLFPIKPQWINPGDFIVKFSLYKETPDSISSTNTAVTEVF